jgi:hypothetical protein
VGSFEGGRSNGGYVVQRSDPNDLPGNFYFRPFRLGDSIGDGVDEITRGKNAVATPAADRLWNLAVDEGGLVSWMDPAADNFIGFVLDSGNYGWIRVQYDSTSPGTMTFLDGAYQDNGSPIIAGDDGSLVVESADFNGDSIVDGADFLIWQRGFGAAGTGTPSAGDANGDLDIYADDLAVWKSQFGGPGALTVAVANIPEPSTMVWPPVWSPQSLVAVDVNYGDTRIACLALFVRRLLEKVLRCFEFLTSRSDLSSHVWHLSPSR